MEYVRRVYVAGVGYTSYLTEIISKKNTSSRVEKSKKEISIANYKNFVQTVNSTATFIDKQHSENPGFQSINYVLNLKVGYSDIKSVDVTNYIIDKDDTTEILIVGKEILATPGYQEILVESEPNTGAVVSPIKAIIIIRGNNKNKVNSLAALIRNIRPYSVYKGIGLRLQGEPLNIKVVVKNKQKS